LNPGVVVDETRANNLAIDVEKSKQDTDDNIYDATPRLRQETTGNSQGVSDQSSANETKQPTPEPKTVPPINTAGETDASPPMELEDTADARQRTIRMDAQEEKIFYDPEGDIPKMSATSYPGQEWNPYGEPEFATDWRDD
jgi:serine/arginine repetitive matrix protein 2